MFRLRGASLGPIRYDDALIKMTDPPDPGSSAGVIGNQVLSRCAAVVVDLAGRALWLEPPCDRPAHESLSGWRLTRRDDDRWKGRPWVIEAIVPSGSAAAAGLREGDRLLSVADVPADLDVAKVDELLQRPAGGSVTVTFVRDGEQRQATMPLRAVLDP
jgi:hypothetical protein